VTDTVQAALNAPVGHMTVSSPMTEMASRAYAGEWAGALSRATTRKGGPGVYTPGPLRLVVAVALGGDTLHVQPSHPAFPSPRGLPVASESG
jgi:hypothetical protein